jgi:PAS domain S-box-containing protein
VTLETMDSELKQAEIRLRQSQESLLFALESARMGTWDIDLETGKVSCSDSMLDLWGLSREGFKGERPELQSKVHPEDLENMCAAVDGAIRSRSVYDLEYRILPKPGVERWVNSRGRCTYDPGSDRPSRLSGVVFDVTRQKTEALERARLHDLSECAVKARDNLISISAHELLTPVSGSKLQMEILKLKLDQGVDLSRKELVRIATQTDENLDRLSMLINDMLDLSRINLGKFTIKPQRVNLSEVIEEAVERSRLLVEFAGCVPKIAIVPGIEAEVDQYRIGQVVSNLISNACRYAYGKPILIELSAPENGSARISVSDQGMGIRQEDHARIFERFERAATLDENAGLGLGLFIVKQIVDAHLGSVRVESELGRGARFMVDLPVRQQRGSG